MIQVVSKFFDLLYHVSTYTDIDTVYYVVGVRESSSSSVAVIDLMVDAIKPDLEQDFTLLISGLSAFYAILKLEDLEVENADRRLIRERLLTRPQFTQMIRVLINHSSRDVYHEVEKINLYIETQI